MRKRLAAALIASVLGSGLATALTTASASAAPGPEASCAAQTIADIGPPQPGMGTVPAGYFGLDGIGAMRGCPPS